MLVCLDFHCPRPHSHRTPPLLFQFSVDNHAENVRVLQEKDNFPMYNDDGS